MNLKQYLTTTYLKVDEIKTEDQWEIKEIDTESEREDKQTVIFLKLYCQGEDKKLQLNQTNLKTLIELFGEVSSSSLYKKLVFKTVDTEFKGEEKKGIRIDVDRTKLVNNIQ